MRTFTIKCSDKDAEVIVSRLKKGGGINASVVVKNAGLGQKRFLVTTNTPWDSRSARTKDDIAWMKHIIHVLSWYITLQVNRQQDPRESHQMSETQRLKDGILT